MKPTIGYVGMTHLGLNSAAASAARGFETVCFDPDPRVIEPLASGQVSIVEPGLPEVLEKHGSSLTFTSDPTAIQSCDVVYISVDVATDDQGQSDLSVIDQLVELVVPHISEAAILVILCQVPPGYSARVNFPKDRLYYQVETLIFGCAVERAMYPERFIVGCCDPRQPLPAAYQTYLNSFDCPRLPMRYESAELAKISINCCLVSMVSVANTLSELCENIGADWGEIVPALKLDKRIGPYAYLKPGLGIAGGNLERDLATICRLSGDFGTDAEVVRSWLRNSRYRRDWVLRILQAEVLRVNAHAHLAILGLAYKENTHSIKNSPSIHLLTHLQHLNVTVFDQVVSASTVPNLRAKEAASALEAVSKADAVIVMTPWPKFKELHPLELAKMMTGRTVIDPFQIFDGRACVEAGLDYFTLGHEPLRKVNTTGETRKSIYA